MNPGLLNNIFSQLGNQFNQSPAGLLNMRLPSGMAGQQSGFNIQDLIARLGQGQYTNPTIQPILPKVIPGVGGTSGTGTSTTPVTGPAMYQNPLTGQLYGGDMITRGLSFGPGGIGPSYSLTDSGTQVKPYSGVGSSDEWVSKMRQQMGI